MITRNASATWDGNLARGDGTMRTPSLEQAYSAGSRFEDEPGTNPDELIGSALAGCFSMALAHGLDQAGHEPESISTSARVHLDPEALAITRIELDVEGRVRGVDADGFREAAREASENCPVGKALAGVEIEVTGARLA